MTEDEAAAAEWDRRQAAAAAEYDRRHPPKEAGKRGGGGGGGADAAAIDALRAEAARMNDTAALSEALPTIRNPKQREKVVADIARIEAGKRSTDARGVTADAAERKTSANDARAFEKDVGPAITTLDLIDKFESANMKSEDIEGTGVVKGWIPDMMVGDKAKENRGKMRLIKESWARAQSGAAISATEGENFAIQSGTKENASDAEIRAGMKALRDVLERKIRRASVGREGTAQDVLNAGGTNVSVGTASDGAPKINGAAQRGQSSGGSVTVRDKQGNTKLVVDSPRVRALIQSGEIQLVGGNGG